MFTCRDATHLMTEADEGALTGLTRFRYALHVTICPHCKACRRQLDQAMALAREIPPVEAPAEIESRAVEAFRARASR